MNPSLHDPWFITAAILAGGHIAFIGYMFIVVSEISESGWWVVFSTLLPWALLSASSIGGLAFLVFGIPLALTAFAFGKKWWQVLAILVAAIIGAFVPRDLGTYLSLPALIVFLGVHLLFTFAKGREVIRSVSVGTALLLIGVGLLWYGTGPS